MDDIYDDLENYNDVNALEELRKDNQQLQIKLEEYAATVSKLQKDYDKLQADYVKLSTNYSSLLKTAKAEVERKTKIIDNLNIEKDNLILGAIQNANKGLLILRRNMARAKSNSRKSQRDEVESGKPNRNDTQETIKHETERLRNDENRLPSLDTVSSGNTDGITKKVNTENKLNSYDKASESKENSAKGKRALSLKHRRKSMPVVSKQPIKFSSDEEYEECSEDDIKKGRHLREDKSRKYFDRQKQVHKVSETSGIDEKYSSYHESSRETYYKARQSDKYRNAKDKSRHQKHFSPERIRRATRDYHEGERQELFRHNRVLVSPPRESYDPLRMLREKRPNYERDRSREGRPHRKDYHEDRQKDDIYEERRIQRHGFYEERQSRRTDSNDRKRGTTYNEKNIQKSDVLDEKQRKRDISLETRQKEQFKERYKKRSHSRDERYSRHHEKIPKASSDNDEPNRKRARMGSLSALEPETEVATMTKEPPTTTEDKLLPQFGEHLQHSSCQSPDDAQFDAAPTAKPKEIMNTAAANIEDPRLTSKMYVKETEGDKVILTAITGKNVDLIPIDLKTWNKPREESQSQKKAPATLQKPPEYTDEMVQNVYMDIDNPISNMSLESGEIHSESTCTADLRMADYVSKNFYQDYEDERINQINARVDKDVIDIEHKRDTKAEIYVNKDDCVNIQSNKSKSSLHLDERRLPPVKYKIPRVTEPEPELSASKTNPLGILLKQLQTVCGVGSKSKPIESKLDVDKTYGVDDDSQKKNAEDEEKPKEFRQLRRPKMSAREIVEGDLALSDETSDNIFTQVHNKKEKVKVQSPGNKTNERQKKLKHTAKPKKTKNDDQITNPNVKDGKTEETTDTQHNVKVNKKTKKKTTSKTKTPRTKESNKTKVKKSESPKDLKTQSKQSKFPDLFGDSCSLITPEDLGIFSGAKQTDKTKKYVPICEDAQDSIDVNVNVMKKKNIDDYHPSCKISIPKSLVTTFENKNKESVSLPVQKINPSIEETHPVENKESDVVKTTTITNKEPVSLSAQNIPEIKLTHPVESQKPDVVKTVIISTGVQLQPEDIESQSDEVKCKYECVDIPTKTHELSVPIALATSTPHKNLLLQLEAEVRCSVSSEVQKDDTTSVDTSSKSDEMINTVQNEDVPDVRIFVRRRRKLKK